MFLLNPLALRWKICVGNDRLMSGQRWPIIPGVGVDNLAVQLPPHFISPSYWT